jgi:hypothetical protein
MSNIRSLAWYRSNKKVTIEEKVRELESEFTKDIEHLQDLVFVLQQRLSMVEKELENAKASKS